MTTRGHAVKKGQSNQKPPYKISMVSSPRFSELSDRLQRSSELRRPRLKIENCGGSFPMKGIQAYQLYKIYVAVAPVAYQVILEPGTGQFC